MKRWSWLTPWKPPPSENPALREPVVLTPEERNQTTSRHIAVETNWRIGPSSGMLSKEDIAVLSVQDAALSLRTLRRNLREAGLYELIELQLKRERREDREHRAKLARARKRKGAKKR